MNRRTFISSAAGVTAAAVTATGINAAESSQAAKAEEQDSSNATNKSHDLDSILPDAREKINWDKPGKTKHTKFALNVESWFNGKVPYPERFAKTAELGFPAVELWPWRNKNLDEIAGAAKEHGLEIAQFTGWGFSPGMNETKNHAAVVKEIKAACAAAKKLSCKKMTVIAGNDVPGMTKKEMHDNVITALKLIKPIAEDTGVMMILEPMNIRKDHIGHCLYGSPDAIRICEEVDSPMVKINWDLYHMHITEGDLCRRMKEGFAQVGYFQLADNPGRHEPGTGEIHYARVMQEAYTLGYRGYIGLEFWPTTDILTAARRVALTDVWT